MFSVFQTKLSAFRESHPIWYSTLDLMFVVTVGYVGFYAILHFETIIQQFGNLIESAGIFIAALPHSLGATIFITFVCLVLSVPLFVREFSRALHGKDDGALMPAFILWVFAPILGSTVISHFPETGYLWRFFAVVGYVQLGFFITVFSVHLWNHAAKNPDIFGKFAWYFASIAFPVMYLIGITEVLKKIFF